MFDLKPDLSAVKPATNEELYQRQMEMLKTFLLHGAISEEQYRTGRDALSTRMRR